MTLDRLRVEREKRGWTKAEYARRAKMNASTISWIESGRFRPYPGQVKKLARALRLGAKETRDLVALSQ